jgi:hypothetical protein
MRLGRYILYGVLFAFVMYLAGATYHHYPVYLLKASVLPLLLWGIFAGVVGGVFVMGLESFTGLIKRKWQTRRKS